MSLLTVQSIARIPKGEPWAARVLAGLIAFELEGEAADPFPDAYPGVRVLAQACSMRAKSRSMCVFSRPSCEAEFVLGPAYPYADGFVLLTVEDRSGMGWYLRVGSDEPEVIWFDASDGSSRVECALERWCQRRLGDWSLQLGDELDHDSILDVPALVDVERYSRYLNAITVEREQAFAAATAEAARLERPADTDEAIEAWSVAADRANSLSGRPWPRSTLER